MKANGDFGGLISGRNSFTVAGLPAFQNWGCDVETDTFFGKTFTVPYIASNPSIYAEIRDKYAEVTSSYLSNPLHATNQFTVNFQPLPSIVGEASDASGGNAMGLRGSDPDVVVITLQTSWQLETDDEQQYEIASQMTEWAATRVPEWLAEASLDEQDFYLPLFMNEARFYQNVTGSYREYTTFKALQEEVDPEQLFSSRSGGFKY